MVLIYIEREIDRERERDTHTHTHTHTYRATASMNHSQDCACLHHCYGRSRLQLRLFWSRLPLCMSLLCIAFRRAVV